MAAPIEPVAPVNTATRRIGEVAEEELDIRRVPQWNLHRWMRVQQRAML